MWLKLVLCFIFLVLAAEPGNTNSEMSVSAIAPSTVPVLHETASILLPMATSDGGMQVSSSSVTPPGDTSTPSTTDELSLSPSTMTTTMPSLQPPSLSPSLQPPSLSPTPTPTSVMDARSTSVTIQPFPTPTANSASATFPTSLTPESTTLATIPASSTAPISVVPSSPLTRQIVPTVFPTSNQPTPTPTTDQVTSGETTGSTEAGSGFPAAAIVGIVIGAVVTILAISLSVILLSCFCCCWVTSKKYEYSTGNEYRMTVHQWHIASAHYNMNRTDSVSSVGSSKSRGSSLFGSIGFSRRYSNSADHVSSIGNPSIPDLYSTPL